MRPSHMRWVASAVRRLPRPMKVPAGRTKQQAQQVGCLRVAALALAQRHARGRHRHIHPRCAEAPQERRRRPLACRALPAAHVPKALPSCIHAVRTPWRIVFTETRICQATTARCCTDCLATCARRCAGAAAAAAAPGSRGKWRWRGAALPARRTCIGSAAPAGPAARTRRRAKAIGACAVRLPSQKVLRWAAAAGPCPARPYRVCAPAPTAAPRVERWGHTTCGTG